MDNNVEARVKELVGNFKLEQALDVLIAEAQQQTQRKQHTLLVLKGKLALLAEQDMMGTVDADDVAKEKAKIAHHILVIAGGSTLDEEEPAADPKTAGVTGKGSPTGRYLLLGGLLVAVLVAGFFMVRRVGKLADRAAKSQQEQPRDAPTADAARLDNQTANKPQPATSSGQLRVQDFPNLRKKFNFQDFQFEFRDVTATLISDSEIQLKMSYALTCRNNAGICYRATIRIYADGNPIAPSNQTNLAGWLEHNSAIKDELTFVLDASAQDFQLELSRDHSTWKRAFKILRK
ncbi:MAG: hypothetical protein DA408_18615 [Bacteroidetes bacterium]|nr:MAG: hypothetical protein C7N36_15690 [Bacteroidota bacterium]PTM09331.1 MAG: hypothetical protein DA408_18615 [Bacteroidota bacterium]